MRPPGTSRDDNSGNCPLGSYSTGEIGGDSFNFGSTSIASGVANPMVFTGSVWPVSVHVRSHRNLHESGGEKKAGLKAEFVKQLVHLVTK